MSLGENIKKLRELKKMTQEEVAAKLNMSHNGYGKIERDEVDVQISRLEQIAQIFGVDVTKIIKGDIEKAMAGVYNQIFLNDMENVNFQQGLPEIEKKLYETRIETLEKEISYLKEINQMLKKS
jgi:transcriptional regulator with XRE-family HTH domain